MEAITSLTELIDELCVQVATISYSGPDSVLIYYGWLNAFNSGVNGWNNEKVAQDMAKYNLIVLGNGVQDPSHGDYTNTSIIVPRVKALNPCAKIFGYVSSNQPLDIFKSKVDDWNELNIDGIFIDEAGYDYGKTRVEFNERISYVHNLSSAKLCFANAWNLDHVLGIENDVSYPNTTFNPNLCSSALEKTDYCLLESFPINTDAYTTSDGYEPKGDWKVRGDKAVTLRKQYGINLVGCGIIADDNANETNLFNFGFISACMYALNAFGTSDSYYGASSAKTKHIARPDIVGIQGMFNLELAINADLGDSDVYLRFCNNGEFKLDFSSGNQTSTIIKY